MIHAWLPGAKFFEGLLEIDEREMRRAQAARCPRCGARLDRADYPRKARGLGLPEAVFGRRFSLCCAREGCRRRLTPVSVRFLGRRVYAGLVVLLASVSSLLAAGVPRRTLRRWLAWWRGPFIATAFFRVARAMLSPPLDCSQLPGALVERFAGDGDEVVVSALVFVRSLSIELREARFSRDGP